MILILTMAGKYERFRNFSYEIRKYLLPLSNRNILYYVLKNFDVKKNFDKVLLVANERDVRFLSQIQSILNEFDSNGELIFIPDTPGQSITALKGLEHLHQQNINDSVVIHNIDTILMNRDFSLFKDKLKKYDCVVDTFYSNNKSYSYILKEGENVVDIIEKRKISDEASSGCYGFSNITNSIKYLNKSENYYISNGIKFMIEDNKKVTFIKSDKEDETIVLGTPEEYINSMAYFDLINRAKNENT